MGIASLHPSYALQVTSRLDGSRLSRHKYIHVALSLLFYTPVVSRTAVKLISDWNMMG